MQIDPSIASAPNPFVRKLEGFTALSDTDRVLLERISAETRLFGPRADLVSEGDKPNGVFLVMEGMVCRHKHRANGARQLRWRRSQKKRAFPSTRRFNKRWMRSALASSPSAAAELRRLRRQ